MAEKKITKAMVFETLRNYVEVSADVNIGGISTEDILAVLDAQLEQLNKKKGKAAEARDKKKAEGDVIKEVVLESLTYDWQTADEITQAVVEATGDETLNRHKISPRLSALVADGDVIKESHNIDGKRKMCYKLTEIVEVVE